MVTSVLVYIHIPKAAGTTLHSIINRNYAKASRHIATGGEKGLIDLQNLNPDKKANLKVVYGHIPFGVHEILNLPVTYITVMRHPVKRLISHYNYVLRSPNHYLHQEVISKNMSLLEYVTSGISSELDNGQTRLLCNIAGDRMSKIGQAEYELALSNIKNEIACVGVQEEFDKSILLFQKLFGWKTPYYKSKNITRNQSDNPISEEIRGAIIAHNKYDMMLYEEAITIFQNSLNSHMPNIEQQLWWFEFKNRWVNRFREL